MTRLIKATANQSKRTFTIRCYDNGVMYAKYRTIQLSQEEFNSEEMNTPNDWEQFLKTDAYYKV
jgi:subtilase family serine protease|tara:strand:+ start:923 stop:1114 length:192 start_codon:yes stop_codon:yes gene_type:complete